ncbi:MAG: hypothetical protein MJZ32_10240 [Bacteroidaceae bacterium]|nr:hypothetical protein [Bacteroidaceae bacterium]
MKENKTIESLESSQVMTEMQGAIYEVEAFLNENYEFRCNVLNGKVEMRELGEKPGASRDSKTSWQSVTPNMDYTSWQKDEFLLYKERYNKIRWSDISAPTYSAFARLWTRSFKKRQIVVFGGLKELNVNKFGKLQNLLYLCPPKN